MFQLRKFHRAYLLVSLICVSLYAFGQLHPADDLLKKHFQAIGEEKLTAIPSILIQGKLIESSGAERYFKMYCKKQQQLHVEWAQAGQRWQELWIEGKGWRISGGEAASLQGQDLFWLEWLARVSSPMRQLNPSRLLPAEARVEGQSFYSLVLNTGKEKLEYLFDKQTFLLAYYRVSVTEGSKLLPQEIHYEHYRDLAGVKMATAYQLKTANSTSELIFDEVVLGYPAPASLFEPPQ